MILALYDVSGIQEYIFQSSRMRENIGASLIVGKVLKQNLPEVLRKQEILPGQKVICDWDQQDGFSLLSDEQVSIEVVYNGGGNAIVAYRNEEDYHTVNEQMARRLIEVSYTLQLAVAAIESSGDNFVRDKERLESRMEQVKAQMRRTRPPGAFPVSEQEGQSGLPITHYDPITKQNVSTLQRLKIHANKGEEKDKVGVVALPENDKGLDKWAFEMKDLILGQEEDSFVAVVHIDGNNMGAQLRQLLNQNSEGKSYSEAVQVMRELSRTISQKYKEIFQDVIKKVCVGSPTDYWKQDKVLPVRPLIMDGDDLTFVCLGAWGVPLAASLLRELENASLALSSEAQISLSACAGIALVHSHFPFDIAYEVAEACCKRAKNKWSQQGGQDAYLDFQVVRDSNPRDHSTQHLQGRPYRIVDTSTSQLRDELDSNPSALQYDDFDALAGSLERFTKTQWPHWRLEKLYSALLTSSQELELYVKECESRGYELKDLYHADVIILPQQTCTEVEDSIYKLPIYKLLFDAMELLQMFDQAIWSSESQEETGGAAC